MVVFTCGYCGDSVNKPKVEKHYMTRCRGRTPNLSCMDCFKDFYGNDHEAHTKCITEEQRYAAAGFVASAKKGETKQSTWVELVQSVLDEQPRAPAGVLRILKDVSKHSNTPRKKPKFVNFVKNVSGHRTSPADIDGAWELIAVKLNDLKAANQQNGSNKVNSQYNGNVSKENGDSVLDESMQKNGDNSMNSENVENEQESIEQVVKSKKQRKEEKKKMKYEAELHSAAAPPPEDDSEVKSSKKNKKAKQDSEVEELKRNKKNIAEYEVSELASERTEVAEGKKNKKRKHSDNIYASSNGKVRENGEASNEIEEVETKKSKKSKRMLENNEETPQQDMEENVNKPLLDVEVQEPASASSFDWHSVILSLLQKKGGEMMYKRLQKKVLCEYAARTGRAADDKAADKLARKLKAVQNVRIDKNRVVLVE